VPCRAVEPLDAAVERRGAGREHVEGNAPFLTGLLEDTHELAAAIDLDRLDRNRHAGDQLREELPGRARGGGRSNPDHRTPADDIDRRELAAFDARQRAQVHRVELDQGTGLGRLSLVPGDPGGKGALRFAGANPDRVGLAEQASPPQAGEDAADHRGTERAALAPEQDLQRHLAHPRMLLAEGEHGLFLGSGPLVLAGGPGTPGAGFEAGQVVGTIRLPPAVDRRSGRGEGDCGCRNPSPKRVLDTEQPELCPLAEHGRVGKASLEPDREVGNDGHAAAEPALLHPPPVSLAMLAHEGILLRLGCFTTTKIPGTVPSIHRCRILICF
jgi:hypothetical protein